MPHLITLTYNAVAGSSALVAVHASALVYNAEDNLLVCAGLQHCADSCVCAASDVAVVLLSALRSGLFNVPGWLTDTDEDHKVQIHQVKSIRSIFIYIFSFL